MGKLKVPESPETYTTRYDALLGIDCSNPRTEISNRHAADMVNMMPDEDSGIPVKRKGWRRISRLDSNIVAAFKDQYNSTTYIATEEKLYARGGSMRFTNDIVVNDTSCTKGENLLFPLPNFSETEEISEPSLGIEYFEMSLSGTVMNGTASVANISNITQTHEFTEGEMHNAMSFYDDGVVQVAKSGVSDIYNLHAVEKQTFTFAEDSSYDSLMPTGNFVDMDVWVATDQTQGGSKWLIEPIGDTYGMEITPAVNYRYNVVGQCEYRDRGRYEYTGESELDGHSYRWFEANTGDLYPSHFVEVNLHALVAYVGDTLTNRINDFVRYTITTSQGGSITSSYDIATQFVYNNGYLITNEYVWWKSRFWTHPMTIQFDYVADGNFANFEITINARYILTSELRSYDVEGIHHIVPFNSTVYFLADSGIYYRNDSNIITPVEPYVPLSVISKNPDGSGGEPFDSVNAFTCKQMYSYIGDGKTAYTFHPTDDFVTILDKVEILNNGVWETTSDYTITTGSAYTVLDEDGDETQVTAHIGVVFTTAPAESDEPNVRFTVYELDTEEYSSGVLYGYYRKLANDIYKSRILTTYGAVNTDRLFIVVGENNIYYSDAGDITYFPDDNYLVAGNYSPIVGLHKKDDYLVAVTGDCDSHAVFLIKSATTTISEQTVDSNNDLITTTYEQQYFAVNPATSGMGAIATNSFATLVDDPLFLGSNGVYSITSHYLSSQTMIVCKSSFINPKLLTEPNLKDAIACVWKHYYMLFVNGHVYVLDANNISRDLAGNKCYEGYYLEGIPATRCVLTDDDELYFASGSDWCMVNTDLDDEFAYYDDYVNSDERGSAVVCSYRTKLDDDGYPQYFKNLNKKGVVITVQANDISSVSVYLSKNGEDDVLPVKTMNAMTDDLLIDVYTLKKVKKYKRLQFLIENDSPEPFGLIKIIKTWTMGNYAK